MINKEEAKLRANKGRAKAYADPMGVTETRHEEKCKRLKLSDT